MKQEPKKEIWLKELAEFIIEANRETWAADKGKVKAQRKGYKEHEYRRENWRLRDSYTGYFRAPGTTTVYYKEKPVWVMIYAGTGMTKGNEWRAKETFGFLRQALMQVSPEMPFRGPQEYVEGDKRYTFKLLEGDITDGLWREEITENGEPTFTQTGFVGLILHRDKNRQVIWPWNI